MVLSSGSIDSSASPPLETELDHFLVCGLGSLGQQCVMALKGFGAIVHAIEKQPPTSWEIAQLPELLETLVIGDFCQARFLEQAGVQCCRSVLIVSSHEATNVEAAFVVRQLNPSARLVVRSAKENLNQLLEENLGNFVAFEPNQLPVSTIALSALGSETLGLFQLEGKALQVLQRQIPAGDRWVGLAVEDLNSRTRRILMHIGRSCLLATTFHQWPPNTRMQVGDTLIYIELTQEFGSQQSETTVRPKRWLERVWPWLLRQLTGQSLQQRWQRFWQLSGQYQTGRVALFSGVILLLLLLISLVLFRLSSPEVSLRDAFYATAILLLGGYGDLFGQLSLELPIPWWLQLFSLFLTLAGTAFVGVLYAMLTEALLTARFQFIRQRPPVPAQDHVVLVGLGKVGQQVALFLEQLAQPLVGVSSDREDQQLLPQLPLMIGDLTTVLPKANLTTAKSVIVATDDEMVNLEVGLLVHRINPKGGLVIQTFNQHFTDSLARLLPYAKVLCANALAAEAFAAAAFGEKVLNLFHLQGQTILVTEYHIEIEDTLHDLLLAEVTYGYGVVPILYQKHQSASVRLLPSEDTRLHAGDRMVVLATSDQLQRIERGEIAPRPWQVLLQRAMTPGAKFEGANVIFRLTGCSLGTARALMEQLPQRLPLHLYHHQAEHLVRELKRIQVQAEALEVN